MDKITANFAIHYSLIYPFPRKLASHNSMRKKDDKVGNKTDYKRRGKGWTKAEKKYRNRFQLTGMIMCEKQKAAWLFNGRKCLCMRREKKPRGRFLAKTLANISSQPISKINYYTKLLLIKSRISDQIGVY